MNPIQEVFNAVSMLAPAAMILYYAYTTRNVLVATLLIGTLMHLPVSFTYHICAALNRFPDRIDNDMRRLDQTLQHVASTIFAFALSGFPFWAFVCSVLNGLGILFLWNPRTSNDGMRWAPINMCAHLYLLPMLWRGDLTNFLIAFEAFWMGGVFFVPWINKEYFFGWGHCVFHFALAVHMAALAESALLVDCI